MASKEIVGTPGSIGEAGATPAAFERGPIGPAGPTFERPSGSGSTVVPGLIPNVGRGLKVPEQLHGPRLFPTSPEPGMMGILLKLENDFKEAIAKDSHHPPLVKCRTHNGQDVTPFLLYSYDPKSNTGICIGCHRFEAMLRGEEIP